MTHSATDEATEQTLATPEQFVAFRIGDQTLLSTLDSIDEITDVMSLSAVPATQPWFLGLGARNGQLLPVSDFAAYIGLDASDELRSRRLLVVCRQGEYFGLTVDEVMGLVNQDEVSISGVETSVSSTEPRDASVERLTPLLGGNGELRGQPAAMIDLPRLLEQPEFVCIGVEG